ncbi:MAG: TonB-dependent receptor [Parvularculaceae bacterium]|nr:TonB-dependent receptor [Parvularculaceae bacterium]
MVRCLIGAGVAASVFLGPGAGALAQDQGESARTGREIETIVVTARKKEESIRETPISITAFSGDTLQRTGVTDIADVALRTPSLSYGDFGDEKLSPVSLRGIVADSGSAGADPAIGVYLDEVFLGQGVGATIDLYDLERVEVLRGPQGALFGRNTIGGVISFTTARPTEEFEAKAQFEYGNFNHLRAAGVVSGAIAPGVVSGRVSIVTDSRDGIADNLVLGRDVNSENSWSTRGQLLFNLSDNAEWLVSGDYRKVDQDSLVFETLAYNDATTFVTVLDLFGLERNADPYDRRVYSDLVTKEMAEIWGVTSIFKASVGAIDVVNVTSYREHEYDNIADTDRSAVRWLYDGDPEDVSRFSTELRFSGAAGPLEWVAGGYYFKQKSRNLSFVEVGADLADALAMPELTGFRAGSDADMETRSIAGFASATFAITDRLDVTFGGRYTSERKNIDYTQVDPLALLGGDFSALGADSWAEFTPNANIRFRVSPDLMLYATVSRGFKSGGFNDALGDADGIAFDPETLWNYEGGVKASLFDGAMEAGASLFYMDWTSIQLSQDNPVTPVFDPIILNAGAAHSVGAEFELMTRPVDGLTLGVNASVVEAEYDEGVLPNGTPLNQVPYAPAYTLNFSGEYRKPVWRGLELFIGGEYLRRGEMFLGEDSNTDARVAPYGLVNIRGGIESGEGGWRITGWAKNLANKRVKQRLFDLFDQDVIGQSFIALNEPRTYGVSLDVSF